MAGLGDLITPATITGVAGLLVPLGRWALKLWAEVRREGIQAAIVSAARREAFETAAAARAEATSERMIEALLEQAQSSTAMAGKLDQLSRRLDDFLRENTPVEPIPIPRPRDDTPSERRKRTRTPLQLQASGYRAPTRGGHDDDT